MVITYNLDKIKAFLTDFHNMTGLTISFWDADMNQLAFVPHEMPAFCKLMKSIPNGKKACLTCDRKLIAECNEKMAPISAKCHAGLIDTAIPIIYEDHTFGFILFGQIKDHCLTDYGAEDLLHALSQKLSLPYEKLSLAYLSLKKLPPEVVRSTTNILQYATLQLLTSKSISLGDHTLINQINEYLLANLQNTLSVSLLCEEFGISKNRLYSLWKKHFDATIGEYILNLRLEKAKNLLTNTDAKVHDICVTVGIPDYNYFSKLFKKHYGLSCREYRRGFPLLLETKN